MDSATQTESQSRQKQGSIGVPVGLEEIRDQIIERLRPLDPETVILFGSYAWGEPTKDSDIDLYVVIKDEFMPKNYKEKSEVYLRVVKQIRDIQAKIPIDIIVHTKPMHLKFIELDSMFCRKLLRDGEQLL